MSIEVSTGIVAYGLPNEDTGFALATNPEGAGTMRDHLGCLLYHTRFKAIQWISLNRHRAEFTTLSGARP
jgi:hypothetical protein